MSAGTGPGPHPPAGRGGGGQPAGPDDTWPHERAQMLLTTADADLFAGVLRPVLGLIATLRIVGHDQPVDVHLDDVVAGGGGASPQLAYRRVDASLQPAAATVHIAVDTIAHLHLW